MLNVFHFQLEKYVSTTKLKYYFAVDTSYVGKKLALIIFPFTHSVSNCFILWFYKNICESLKI